MWKNIKKKKKERLKSSVPLKNNHPTLQYLAKRKKKKPAKLPKLICKSTHFTK